MVEIFISCEFAWVLVSWFLGILAILAVSGYFSDGLVKFQSEQDLERRDHELLVLEEENAHKQVIAKIANGHCNGCRCRRGGESIEQSDDEEPPMALAKQSRSIQKRKR